MKSYPTEKAAKGTNHTTRYRGVVKGIRTDYEDPKLASIEVEDTSTPKPKPKKGQPMTAYPSTKSHVVPVAFAKDFAIGDAVECETTIRRIRKAKRVGR